MLVACGKDDFHGAEPLQFTADGRVYLIRRSRDQLRRRELARGEIGVSDPRPRPLEDDRRDVGVGCRAWPGRSPFPASRCGSRRGRSGFARGPDADLLADGDFVTGRDEPGDVTVSRVVRNPGHGNADALAHLPAGEHDIQDTRRGFASASNVS